LKPATAKKAPSTGDLADGVRSEDPTVTPH
jgi:hypothetical protein